MKQTCNIFCYNFLFESVRLRMSQSLQWFYAVGRGRQAGVYTTWSECFKQVENISNAKYRKYKTREEAIAFVEECRANYSPIKLPPKPLSQSDFQQTLNVAAGSFSSSQSLAAVPSRCLSFTKSENPLSPVKTSQEIKVNPPRELNFSSQNQTATSGIVPVLQQSNFSERTSTEISNSRSFFEEDPFLFETTMAKPQNSRSTSSLSSNEILEIRTYFDQIDKRFTEIKETLDNMILKLNDLDSKVAGLSSERKTRKQDNTEISGKSLKRTLFEGYNVPQRVVSREFSTTSADKDVEIVPVPPKKVPKVEISSDEEPDGFSNDFKVNENGYVIVYTDGACENNGKRGAKAGIGVWFGDAHPLNCSEPVQGRPTNNTAEIQAAVHALEIAKRAGVKKISVHTDSEFLINCITKWIHNWIRNDWKLSSGGNVKNKDDLILLLDAMKGIDVKWEHVRGHTGIHGNEMADRLARSGAERYKS